MYMWGVTLMIIGGFSFLLPLIGRQFVLVYVLGLTGAGPVIGLVLFGIGLFLFTTANQALKSTERPSHSLDEVRRPPTEVLAPSLAKETERQPVIAVPTTFPKGEGRFGIGGGEDVDPYQFGLGIVRGALESSPKIVAAMTQSAETPSQQAIKAHEGLVQMHALALVSATYYVCANNVSGVDKLALTRLATGMVDGFTAIFDPTINGESARRNALSVYALVQDYANSLATELDSHLSNATGDNSFDMGPTARLVVHNIAGQCGIQETLAQSDMDQLMLETTARGFGILALMNLLGNGLVTYSVADGPVAHSGSSEEGQFCLGHPTQGVDPRRFAELVMSTSYKVAERIVDKFLDPACKKEGYGRYIVMWPKVAVDQIAPIYVGASVAYINRVVRPSEAALDALWLGIEEGFKAVLPDQELVHPAVRRVHFIAEAIEPHVEVSFEACVKATIDGMCAIYEGLLEAEGMQHSFLTEAESVRLTELFTEVKNDAIFSLEKMPLTWRKF